MDFSNYLMDNNLMDYSLIQHPFYQMMVHMIAYILWCFGYFTQSKKPHALSCNKKDLWYPSFGAVARSSVKLTVDT